MNLSNDRCEDTPSEYPEDWAKLVKAVKSLELKSTPEVVVTKKTQKEYTGPGFLYRHFDKDGVLLYVGISLGTFARQRAHRHNSPWFHDIETIKIQKFPNMWEASLAEREAIETEKPKYNKVFRNY